MYNMQISQNYNWTILSVIKSHAVSSVLKSEPKILRLVGSRKANVCKSLHLLHLASSHFSINQFPLSQHFYFFPKESSISIFCYTNPGREAKERKNPSQTLASNIHSQNSKATQQSPFSEGQPGWSLEAALRLEAPKLASASSGQQKLCLQMRSGKDSKVY